MVWIRGWPSIALLISSINFKASNFDCFITIFLYCDSIQKIDIKFGCMPMLQDCVGGFELIIDGRMAKEGLPEKKLFIWIDFCSEFLPIYEEKSIQLETTRPHFFCFNHI